MINLPLVSIVTPSFNQGQFIRATIESVLSQDYPNIEYWVVDGGSTDATLSILKEYEGNPRFHWLSESDEGQAHAVQKGWELCEGEILGWLNSDDVYKPGAVRRAVLALNQNPSAAFVYSNYERIDEDGKHLNTIRVRQADLTDQFFLNCQIPQQTVFLRKYCLEYSGGLNIKLHYTMDQEYWLRILIKNEAKYIDETWAQQRIHPQAKTQTAWQKIYQEFYQIILEYSKHDGVPKEVSEEAVRRGALNMFIVESCQGDLDRSVDFLSTALGEDGQYPFGSISYCIKHVTYVIRHWHSRKQAQEIFSLLLSHISHSPVKNRVHGFVLMLNAYNNYQDGDMKSAHAWFKTAVSYQPDMLKDEYLWRLQYYFYLGKSSITIARSVRSKFTKINSDLISWWKQ